MKKIKLKIGTRASQLALIQAQKVKTALMQAHQCSGECIEIIPMSTRGDRILDRDLTEIGGKGLFTEEIEKALHNQSIDLAVHSAKDISPLDTTGLCVDIFLKRENPSDVFISPHFASFQDLPPKARIGTASIRRRALIKHLRPDLETVLLRGNVETRLGKLTRGDFDATFLAYAGLKRLDLLEYVKEIMPEHLFPPSPGQGAIAIQTRNHDAQTLAVLQPISDLKTTLEVSCERAFTAALDGSCRTPLGAIAHMDTNQISLFCMILSPDGQKAHRYEITGDAQDKTQIALRAADNLRAQAGEDFFKYWT